MSYLMDSATSQFLLDQLSELEQSIENVLGFYYEWKDNVGGDLSGFIHSQEELEALEQFQVWTQALIGREFQAGRRLSEIESRQDDTELDFGVGYASAPDNFVAPDGYLGKLDDYFDDDFDNIDCDCDLCEPRVSTHPSSSYDDFFATDGSDPAGTGW